MENKATRIELLSLGTPQMRAFHLSWLAFFVCFFAWFAIAPLMPLVKTEFGLDKNQIANINIAAVAVTILVRLLLGPMCDRFGPRRAARTPACCWWARSRCSALHLRRVTTPSCSFAWPLAPLARAS